MKIASVPTKSNIKVQWNVVRQHGDRVRYYIVQNINTTQEIEIKHPYLSPVTKTLSANFHNLLANRKYYFRVRSKNPTGLGPWSDTIPASTERAGKF